LVYALNMKINDNEVSIAELTGDEWNSVTFMLLSKGIIPVFFICKSDVSNVGLCLCIIYCFLCLVEAF
jgi:hypothetical protein